MAKFRLFTTDFLSLSRENVAEILLPAECAISVCANFFALARFTLAFLFRSIIVMNPRREIEKG
jgi:hypothetical protein